ncbi:MAG: methyltransferase domain-containing protein [Planctomycetota bacterium]
MADGATATAGDGYLEPYRRAAAQMGAGFDATLWHSRAGQRLRFAVMAEMVGGLSGRRVLDAGCGPGDFAAWMLDNGHDYAAYRGVDGVDEVVEHARSRGLARAGFVAGDFVADGSLLGGWGAEVVTLSGALNTMSDATAMGVLASAWAAAGRALVFNFLSDTCEPARRVVGEPARRLPTLGLLDWAMERTAVVRFRQDYFSGGHDATIAMVRPGSGHESEV